MGKKNREVGDDLKWQEKCTKTSLFRFNLIKIQQTFLEQLLYTVLDTKNINLIQQTQQYDKHLLEIHNVTPI